MARKPARMFRRLRSQPYTRREYTGGVPNNRITQFTLGDRQAYEQRSFDLELELCVTESCMIRHSALEAGRVTANSRIRKSAGPTGYALRVRVYPHHILRENKQATGAGADRVSQGMRSAFGKNVGTAARVKSGQAVMTVMTNPGNFLAAKDALRKASMKFPSPCRILIKRGREQLKGLA